MNWRSALRAEIENLDLPEIHLDVRTAKSIFHILESGFMSTEEYSQSVSRLLRRCVDTGSEFCVLRVRGGDSRDDMSYLVILDEDIV